MSSVINDSVIADLGVEVSTSRDPASQSAGWKDLSDGTIEPEDRARVSQNGCLLDMCLGPG
jgi:hypothetical protein